MQKTARPIGVTIIALLAILTGIGGLIGGIAIAAFASLFAGIGFGVGGLLAGIGYIIGGIVAFFGVIWLLTGWGLITGKGWARTLALIFSILSLIGTLLFAVSGSYTGIVGVVIMGLMLYYLFTPPVKSFFSGTPGLSSTGGSASFSPGSMGRPSIPTSFANPMGSSSSFGSSSSGSSNLSSTRFCTNCGATLSPGSSRCSSCGKMQ